MTDKPEKTTLLLTRKNWSAFELKFRLQAMKAKVWAHIDPSQAIAVFAAGDETKLIPSATEAQNLAAITFLAERVHDDIAWVLTSDNDDLNARTAYTNLKNEIGKLRQSPDSAIDKLKSIKMNGNNSEKYFADIDESVNLCRQLGVTSVELGARHIALAMINGLESPSFDAVKAQLLYSHTKCTWSGTDILNLETMREQINAFIVTFNPKPRSSRHDRPDRFDRFDRSDRIDRNPPRNDRGNNNNNRPEFRSGDKSKPYCSTCFILYQKVYNGHSAQECSNKDKLARAHAAFSSVENKATTEYFILDSGASHTMSPDDSVLINYVPFDAPRPVVLGNATTIQAKGKGTMVFKSLIDSTPKYVPFYNTLHVPKLGLGLISVPVLLKSKYNTTWNSEAVNVYRNGQVILKAELSSSNLFQVLGAPLPDGPEARKILTELQTVYVNSASYSDIAKDGNWFLLWHRRLAHLGNSTLLKTTKHVSNVDLHGQTSMDPCDVCVVANAKRAHHRTSASKSLSPGDLIHADHGILGSPTIHGETAYLIMVDDSDHWIDLTMVSTLTAEETLRHFRRMEARMKVEQLKAIGTVQIVRSDEHGAFQGRFKQYLVDHGIKQELTVRYEHESAGFVERMNRTIGERHRAQMVDASVPSALSGYSLLHATYVTNRVYTSTEESTPLERRYKMKPDLSHLRVFFCPAVVTLPKELHRKDSPEHGIRCRYLGRSDDHKADLFIEVDTHRIITSNAARFFEDWKSNTTIDISKFSVEFDEIVSLDDSYSPSQELLDQPPSSPSIPSDGLRRSSRLLAQAHHASDTFAVTPPDDVLIHDTVSQYPESAQEWWGSSEDELVNYDFDAYHAFAAVCSVGVPSTLKEARNSPDWKHYRAAMVSELTSLYKNQTWKNTPRSKFLTRKTVKCKWVFSRKVNHDGSLNKYKARLVAKGFTQRHGIDYTETFAPTMALKSFRALVAMAAAQHKRLFQADVPTAFVRADLGSDTVLMEPPLIPDDVELPDGFEKASASELLLLQKSLYGLKQSPRYWYGTFRKALLTLGFRQSHADPCIFSLHKNGSQMILGLYVDDTLYFGDDLLIQEVMSSLKAEFEITELGVAKWFLGIHIDQSYPIGKITLDQTKYVTDFLSQYQMLNSIPISTPLVHNYAYELKQQPIKNYIPPLPYSYNEVVGKLMYAMVATRPDICCALGIVSRYLKAPTSIHWSFLLRILQYLNSTKDIGITYSSPVPQSVLDPIVFTDADYANDPDKARSISGHTILLSGGAVVWYSKKQSTTAQSTAESELIAANICTRTVVWLRQLLMDLSALSSGPTIIQEDNQSCIAIGNNPQLNEKTAHIQVRYHYIHEKIEDSTVQFAYCSTQDQVADIFTKGLSRLQFTRLRSLLGCFHLGGNVTIPTSSTKYETLDGGTRLRPARACAPVL